MIRQTKVAAVVIGSLLILGVSASASAAAQPAQPGRESGGGMQPRQGGMTEMEGMHGGQGMRDGGCSPMCQMMMEREMRAMPWMMAGGAIFGTLLVIALVLLIVLEILWILLWVRRLKHQKLEGRA